MEIPTNHLSPFQMASVAASLPPFLVDCHSLHLDEGIAVGVDQNELGSFVGFDSFVNTLATLDISPCLWKYSAFRTL